MYFLKSGKVKTVMLHRPGKELEKFNARLSGETVV